MKLTLILALSCAMTCSVFAQTQDGETKPKTHIRVRRSRYFPTKFKSLRML